MTEANPQVPVILLAQADQELKDAILENKEKGDDEVNE